MEGQGMRRQSAVRGRPRLRLSSCAEKSIERAIEREAKRWNCSKSFVIATACAYSLNVDVNEHYDKLTEVPRKRKAG